MKVSEVLEKIIYKATIQTYIQNTMSTMGRCLQEGYSSDLKSSIFADLEVAHIGHDDYRERVAIIVSEKECINLLKTKSVKDIVTYLKYEKAHNNIERDGIELQEIKDSFIRVIKSYK